MSDDIRVTNEVLEDACARTISDWHTFSKEAKKFHKEEMRKTIVALLAAPPAAQPGTQALNERTHGITGENTNANIADLYTQDADNKRENK